MVHSRGKSSIWSMPSNPTFRAYLPSFGRRKNRPLGAQKQGLMEELLPRITVALPETGNISLEEIFSGKKEVWVEIGFGGGEHLAHQAGLHPDIGFIGCEPFIDGVASLLRHINAQDLSNVRLFTDDARLLLEKLPPSSINKIFILYPDPWPKTRHHKRRIVSAATLALLARILKPGAELQLASDHADYVTWMLEHLIVCDDFVWTAKSKDDWEKPPINWLSTRYEQKTMKEGRKPTYLRFIRK